MAQASRARGSDPWALPPNSKRRKTAQSSLPSAGLPEAELCTDADATAMEGQGDCVSKASGAESASASNTPSEDAPEMPHGHAERAERGHSRSSGGSEGSHRQPPGPAELGGALGFFLKRSSQLEEPSSASQFSAMFRDLKSDDSTRQIMALTELSEYLSFSSEEALISFPTETFIPVLISLLENPGHSDESAAQVMLLCCRCLFNVVDILPPTARIITAAGGLPVLCANLLNVEYIDVAELTVAIVEWIAEDQPIHVLKAGGLQAILTFLDFFQISVQRQAANAAALMLLPVPPADVLEQHVRPTLPTLAQLLQHGDPQVLQSVCECWRRVLDNTIAIHGRPRALMPNSGPSSSLGRMVVKGKWRPIERGKKDGRGEEVPEQPPTPAAPVPLPTFLEEMCPGSVLSNLLLLLGNNISSPTPHGSVVAAEVLYILAVLTNYSDAFAEEVLKQDAAALLRQMVLGLDLGQSSGSVSQPSLLRVLAAVASMLPAVHLVDSFCECEEKRLALFKEHPNYLDALGEAFLPLLLDVYEASMDPSIQSLSVTLLLAFFLACRERPELIRKSLDPTQLARFLANLLLVGPSKSTTLACLLIVHELLDRHPTPYSLLFVRHGVVRAIHKLVTKEDSPQRRARASNKARARSKAQLVEEVAHRVLASYFASSSHTGESAILKALVKIAKQLRTSPSALASTHREALLKLHDLLLTSDGITAFELTCSGTASALNAFLYPGTGESASTATAHAERLRLFIECIGKADNDSLARLVRLCVSAVQRLEPQPLALFPTHASLTATLPPHLRSQTAQQAGGKGESPSSARGGLGGDFPPGFNSRMGGRGHDTGASTSGLLSVLKLLAKPVRVRMSPAGAHGRSLGPGGPPPNFRELLMPFGGKAAPPRFLEPKASGPGAAAAAGISSASSAAKAAAAKAAAAAAAAITGGGSAGEPVSPTAQPSVLSPSASASPAARLRNYLASKVSRKRASPPAGVGIGGSAASSSAPSEKRSGAGMISRTEAKAAGRPAAPAGDPWSGPGPWDDEDGGRGSGEFGGGMPDRDEATELATLHALEAVLLVEPFALVSALEDYIWEKHGAKASSAPHSSSLSAAAAAAGSELTAGDRSEGAPSASANAPSEMAGSAGSGAAAGTRLRLSMKQPALNLPRERERPQPMSEGVEAEAGGGATTPHTPLAIVDPNSPLVPDASAAGQAGGSAADSAAADATTSSAPAPASSERLLRGAEALGSPPRKKVKIYLNGQLLASKTSVVQALVGHAGRLPRSRAPMTYEEFSQPRGRGERFLVAAEEGSGSEHDASAGEGTHALGAHASPRLFCGAIWGRVHSMTYEIVDEATAAAHSEDADRATGSSRQADPDAMAVDQAARLPFVATDFDCLVHCHMLVPDAVSALQTPAVSSKEPPPAGSSAACAAAVEAEEREGGGELTPRSSAAKELDGAAGAEQESLATMLQLISAFHYLWEYVRSTQVPSEQLTAEDEPFHCNALTAMLLRQLSDPLAVCTGSVPPWCTKLAGACPFLFPYSVRRILHHSCNLGLGRALHHVQQRALAQHAHSQEAQRRLEGEVAMASIPRQKVRISRQRLLESAVKVMNLYGAGSAILEVEYVGEVGTGSGPTLEFYAQVAEILRTAEPRLFRNNVPQGMLFPEPWDPQWLSRAEDQAAQQILERFRLLGHMVAKCILDSRLVDVQLHPLFWRAVLGQAPFSQSSLREVDPELYGSLNNLRNMPGQALSQLCVDFTLPGHPQLELKQGGASVTLAQANLEEYISLVAEASLVKAVAPQVGAFRTAFQELLPLEACRIWSEKELASIIMGASVRDDACWTLEHLAAHVKAQHGYTGESRCFRDLLACMNSFGPEDRRKFLTFVTGAPSLPIGGFSGLKPPLTVVKKEAPPAPLTPDQFMPSVMTCANYLKLPEYSSAEILKQKLELAMCEGQSAFLLS